MKKAFVKSYGCQMNAYDAGRMADLLGAEGYAGLRIAKDGRRFRIADGIIWPLIDSDGINRGQAATFPLPASG